MPRIGLDGRRKALSLRCAGSADGARDKVLELLLAVARLEEADPVVLAPGVPRDLAGLRDLDLCGLGSLRGPQFR